MLAHDLGKGERLGSHALGALREEPKRARASGVPECTPDEQARGLKNERKGDR
jgi:hypothetical protein